ncbi:MAG TPA: cysteine--tRNA ligase [Acidimicrobiales bacterium]|nr:cysteine--tRNA ligase [Acidimicrobiales bacterium]
MLRLHDTALGTVRELDLRDPGRVSIYVCGPTVYGPPHIGHGRQMLVYDVLRRYLEWTGLVVHHVSNITDIDDQIIARAAQEGRSETEVATEFEQAWNDALEGLGVLPPHDAPHATAYVPGMVELVEDLVAKDIAYETSDGVYFAVEAVDGYGLLAGQPLDSLRAGQRVDVVDEKRSPWDFVLWKKSKPGEPQWDSPWGPGRPGWHTECVVMSLGLLGDGFDLHTGGLDLQFPHHENERAQAVALGRTFARHWMHHAFVETAGEKMSKSLGNFTTLPDLLARTDPRAYRLLVLQAHYRSPLEVVRERIADAERSLDRLDELARRWEALGDARPSPPAAPDRHALDGFRAAMDDDLGTPAATGSLFALVRSANSALDGGDMARAAPLVGAVEEMAGALGLVARAADTAVGDEVAALVAERDEARAVRDFARSDAIRDRLTALGYTVKDTAGGTTVHR